MNFSEMFLLTVFWDNNCRGNPLNIVVSDRTVDEKAIQEFVNILSTPH